jgi:hypothetical protein
MQDLTINVAGEDFTLKDILNLVAAASIQQKTRNRAHYWRHQSLLAGSYLVSSKDSGLPIFAGSVGVGEVGTNWLLKVTDSYGPTLQEI